MGRGSVLVRVPRDIYDEWNIRFPKIKKPVLIRDMWNIYSGYHNLGRFIYGDVWKKK